MQGVFVFLAEPPVACVIHLHIGKIFPYLNKLVAVATRLCFVNAV